MRLACHTGCDSRNTPYTTTIISTDIWGNEKETGLNSPRKLSKLINPLIIDKSLKKKIKGKYYYKIANNLIGGEIVETHDLDAFFFFDK